MEFLLISESKLKIVIDDEEMEKYKLDSINPDTGGGALRRAFWQVLDMAKKEVGFDPKGDKVLIQFYPVKSGGCEVFVTKLGILPETSARLVSRSDKVAMLSKKRSYYSFATLDDLIRASKAIKCSAKDISPQSDVYSLNEIYYLVIDEYGRGGELMEFPCILEFSKPVCPDFAIYVLEHSKRLTNGDAIDKFSVL